MSKELFDLGHTIEMAEQIAADIDKQQEYQQMLDASVLETNDLLKELLEQYRADSQKNQEANHRNTVLSVFAAIFVFVSAVAAVVSLCLR